MDYTTLLTMAAVIAVGYFLLIRPSQKRQAEQQKTLSSIEPGVRIMTTAGVFATVVHLGEKQAVLEISPGVEMTIAKAAIAKVVAPADEEFEYDDASAELAATVDEAATEPIASEAVPGTEFQGYPRPDDKI